MTIRYEELDWKLFSDSPKEPANIDELMDMLYPSEGSEGLFYEEVYLKLILQYVQQQLINYKTNEIIASGIAVQAIELCYRISADILLLEYCESIKVEKMIDYLIENKNNRIKSISLYESFATIIAMYFVTKEKTDALGAKEQSNFIELYLSYTKKGLFAFKFNEIYDIHAISLDLLRLLLKTSFETESSIAENLALRSLFFYISETELQYFSLGTNFKKFEEDFNKYLQKLMTNENKLLANMIRFLSAMLNEESYKVKFSIVLEVIKSVNNKNLVFQQQDINLVFQQQDIINVINELIVYCYYNEEDEDIYTGKKLVKAIFSSKFKISMILPNITNSTIEMLLSDLFRNNAYEDFYKIYTEANNERKEFIRKNLTFETAYVSEAANNKELAKKLYTQLSTEEKTSSAVFNNLSLIYKEEKQYDKALELLLQGEKINPKDKYIQTNLKEVQTIIKELKQRPKRMKDYYFKKTDKLQKQILFTLYKLSDSPDFSLSLVREALKISDIYFFNKKVKPLLDNELIREQAGKIFFDPTIFEIVEAWVDPKVERQIIKANRSKLYRPIFYHESEINLYRILIESFPQHLVFPNMDLKTIIDVDKIRELISSDEMSYLFKAHVDFAIINTTTYFPIICFEKDSDYNDRKKAEQNSIMKNRIFETSGLTLIRIRYNSAMEYERLKEEIKSATKKFLIDTQSEFPESSLLNEFDLKQFGIDHSVVEEGELEAFWKEVVGDLITQNTLNFSLNQHQMLLSVTLSKSVETIISMGIDNIKEKIYNEYPQLNQINFYYE